MPTIKDPESATTLSSVHLDAIRGAAALVVLLGHTRDLFFSSLTGKPADVSLAASTQEKVPTLAGSGDPKITIGNEAVMVFFVLSGYLVGGSVLKSLKRNTWSWKSYLIKRLTRLWVVLLPALAFGVILDHVGLSLFQSGSSIYAGPPQQQIILDDLRTHLTARVIAANTVFLQAIFFKTAGTNESLWSLANEFWYYISFPALLLAFKKNQKLWMRCVYVLIGGSILVSVGMEVSRLFLVWMLGAFISTIPLVINRAATRTLSVIMMAFLPVMLVLLRHASLSLYTAEWLAALLFAVTLYVILHQTERPKNKIYQLTAGFFSRISYTLYLVHLPVAVFLCAWVNTPWQHWSKTPKHLAIFFSINIALVLFSYIFYLLFERNTDKVRYALFRQKTTANHLPPS
jgi:peptidoglycan/LPS O-acetylase OafA/YrhL